ncbi:glycosyltransferase family 4 protein [Aliarcobacter skirrowii]|uniref:glycosyltransferase family 4 protein n=1 Tax=Aliarcobacter skirrowii TaxID=28200 RepID=UPI0021B167D5|nr:glycosyltransferase family 4 protein [Aliarcobacter skirrowii]MCT7446763.1 glycosyltransferase family 4 protein [Aliarcobacter skirrowii]
MSNKKVYFNIRPTSRERMWDTPKHAHEVCEVLLPEGIQQQSSIKTYASSTSLMSKIKYEASKKLINKQKIDSSVSVNADLLYMWGAFPKNSDKPFILELDNPYTPAYYHLENFKRNKEKIKDQLDKAYKITYLSETCKNHAIEVYGKDIEEKSFVNYPYMSENYKKNNRSDDEIINFIFVGLNSRGKGGDELLEAFSHTKEKNIRLTFISNLSDEEKSKYQKDSRITILPPQPRVKLLNEIYPRMDVMVFPSFYESFGVVLLEALSFGMGIITLNTYATPEIVQNNYNGKLLHHPILKPTTLNCKEVVNCVDLRIQDFHDRYLKHDEFYYGMYEELKSAIFEANSDYKKWQENSLELFNSKFSPNIWLNNFINIIN